MGQTPPGLVPWTSLDTRTRGPREVIRSERDVKSWMEAMPSTDAVRPARCPVGQGLGLHGHGVRTRQGRGPAEPDAAPQVRVFCVRRYRCTRCRATATVVPREVLTRRLFTAGAIALALALALWGLLRLPGPDPFSWTVKGSQISSSSSS